MAFLTEPRSQPAIRAPAVVWLLIALIVGLEIGREYVWPGSSDAIMLRYGLVPAHFSPAWAALHPAEAGSWFDRALSLVTFNLLHGSFLHVGVNALWLLAFGSVVARRLGTPLFLIFFVLCGIAAAALHLALNWGSLNPVIGASGAISGLMAAGIRMADFRGAAIDQDVEVLRPLTDRMVLSFTMVWTIANIAAGLTNLGVEAGQTIAWQAHIGGYFAGLLLATPFDAIARRRPLKV